VRPYDHQKRCVSQLRDAFTQKGQQIIQEAGNTQECYRFWLIGKRQLLVRRWAVQAARLQPAEVDCFSYLDYETCCL
jgi:hypothetical protein